MATVLPLVGAIADAGTAARAQLDSQAPRARRAIGGRTDTGVGARLAAPAGTAARVFSGA